MLLSDKCKIRVNHYRMLQLIPNDYNNCRAIEIMNAFCNVFFYKIKNNNNTSNFFNSLQFLVWFDVVFKLIVHLLFLQLFRNNFGSAFS